MKKHLKLAVIASVALGLAPFTPEPHIWKQIKNIWFGRKMLTIDWIDCLIHGLPWIVLVAVVIQVIRGK